MIRLSGQLRLIDREKDGRLYLGIAGLALRKYRQAIRQGQVRRRAGSFKNVAQ